MTPRPDTLLLLSGGIDSAYCLWQRVKAGQSTRVHHVSLRDKCGRHPFEDAAVRNILAWLGSHGGKGLIHYTESVTDFGGLRYVPRNHHLWAYWTGVILSFEPHLLKVVKATHVDAFRNGPDTEAVAKVNRTYDAGIRAVAGRVPVWDRPMAHLLKAEVVAAMPSDLLKLCWFCRVPAVGGRPCGTCYTCSLVLPALRATP